MTSHSLASVYLLTYLEPKIGRPQSLVQGVQVTATPSKNRQNQLLPGLPQLKRSNTVGGEVQTDFIPPSSVSRIMNTSRKGRESVAEISSTHKGRRGSLPTIEQTPSRGPSRIKDQSANQVASMMPIVETIQMQCSATPSKATKFDPCLFVRAAVSSQSVEVKVTPSRSPTNDPPYLCGHDRNQDTLDEVLPSMNTPQKEHDARFAAKPSTPSLKERNASIYESLGWDDIDDLS